jgi:hypothetical protein
MLLWRVIYVYANVRYLDHLHAETRCDSFMMWQGAAPP